jgi:hypothetical protein
VLLLLRLTEDRGICRSFIFKVGDLNFVALRIDRRDFVALGDWNNGLDYSEWRQVEWEQSSGFAVDAAFASSRITQH